jgi:hypothetical protein
LGSGTDSGQGVRGGIADVEAECGCVGEEEGGRVDCGYWGAGEREVRWDMGSLRTGGCYLVDES